MRTVFTDLVVPQRTQLNYVVRAVDTNGNATDSAPAPVMTPDWTAPTAPVLTLSVQGTTATLRWRPAADNIGVVGYDVLRDNKQVASMTAAVRTYKDIGVPKGVAHVECARARRCEPLGAVGAADGEDRQADRQGERALAAEGRRRERRRALLAQGAGAPARRPARRRHGDEGEAAALRGQGSRAHHGLARHARHIGAASCASARLWRAAAS